MSIDTMDENDFLTSEISESIKIKEHLLRDTITLDRVREVAKMMVTAVAAGNRIFFGGNGGSAADAQHLAAELVSRYEFDRPGLASIALTTDTSIITAIANDYGYERLFARQLEALARPGDIFVGITTSGKSKNILAGFDACKTLGVTTVALCGLGGDLDGRVDVAIRVPSTCTPRIQECHILLGHALCGYIERQIFGNLAPQ